MNIIEKCAVRPAADAVDCERFRLRGFVEGLPAEELETRREPVDLADVAALNRFDRLRVVRAGALLAARLHHSLVAPRGLHHFAPLAHHQRERLLAIHILARITRRDGHQRVPVIGSRDNHGVNVSLV